MRLTQPVFGQPRIRIEYVAFDSHGVKSMCTRVTTPEVRITIDPGASAESASFPLPERRRKELAARYEQACRSSCASSQVIVISHYHLDHFLAQRAAETYGRKVLFAKDRKDLPPNQSTRAERFFRSIDGLPEETIMADGRKFKFGKTEIAFSKPVWHGTQDAEPGTVIMTEIRRGNEKALVTSDVSGPVEKKTTDLICAAKAQTVVLDGYPTATLGQSGSNPDIVRSIINVCRIIAQPEVKTVVADHHMARDYRYPAFYKIPYEKAKELGKQFGTAAEVAAGRTSMVVDGFKRHGATRWRRWSTLDRKEALRILESAVSSHTLTKDWLEAFRRWVE